jgi:hypothetical protein
MRIVGAGLGRTGTLSLKLALEKLLGAPCYHMLEVVTHPEHIPVWHAAAEGRFPDWRAFLSGYAAAVDWPAASFYRELMAAFPDALVVLSERDAESWWRSAHATIFPSIRRAPPAWRAMVEAVFAARFTAALEDREACIAAYAHHNAEVRRVVPPARLVEWNAKQGWAPLCAALELPVPDAPFPHANSTEEFLGRIAQQSASPSGR